MIEIKVRKTKFVDVDLTFRKHPITDDIAKKVDESAIVTSLRNLVNTEKFDHPFHPEIYSPVRSLLFENLTPDVVSTIKRTIEYLIQNYEPRVTLVSLSVTPYANDAGIEITIFFRIVGVVETIKTSFTLTRTL
jgi:predicted component of type VI protein secretion system